jgi:hypothetical protein
MATYTRIDEITPNGGDYSEIYYLNDNGEPADEKEATNCIIRECRSDGSLINETFGEVNND